MSSDPEKGDIIQVRKQAKIEKNDLPKVYSKSLGILGPETSSSPCL
jgi:hypothetical protein